MRRSVAAALVVSLCVVSLVLAAGCGGRGAGEPAGSTPVLRVGTEASFAPFEYVDDATGEYKGFDIDLINAIARVINHRVEIRNIAWDGLRPALANGEVDCIVSSMTITEERAQVLSFSDPYFTTGHIICAPAGTDIKGSPDLVGRRVGVQANTTGHYAVQKIPGMDDKSICKFETVPDAFQALLTGSVDAVVAGVPAVLVFVKNNPQADFVTIEGAFAPEYYGIAMRKDDDALTELINRGLSEVKSSGEYQAIYDRYFQ